MVENIWSLPDNVPYAIDARMEIVGTDGAIYIDNSGSHYTVLTKKGLVIHSLHIGQLSME